MRQLDAILLIAMPQADFSGVIQLKLPRRGGTLGGVPSVSVALDAISMPREKSFSLGVGSFGMSRFGWMQSSHEALVYGRTEAKKP